MNDGRHRLQGSPFELEPDFYLRDNRFHREVTPVNGKTLEAKHSVALPEWVVKGKTILDLGSCLGATGHWCLFHGATEYTGIELQTAYSSISNELLGRHWNSNQFKIINSEISAFLNACEDQKYDVVIAAGVLYAFLDYYSILKNISRVARQWVVIESLNSQKMPPGFMGVEISKSSTMTLPENRERAQGLGSIVSFRALSVLMEHFGFVDTENLLRPPAVEGVHDVFNEILKGGQAPGRYLMRFQRAHSGNPDLSQELSLNKFNRPTVEFSKYIPGIKTAAGSWKFDSAVAEDFNQIALTSIPRYQETVTMGLEVASRIFPEKKCRIIDVGSAIGYTIDQFIQAGFDDVWGVENSKAMFDKSLHKEKVILSDSFPIHLGPYDVVCANWVLHFMNQREQYLESIFEGLALGGVFILSEKIQASPLVQNLYHDFKRKNGLSESQIRDKEAAIKGILNPYPLEWYFVTLKEIGFSNIEIVNSYYNFVTIICRKEQSKA